MSNDNFFDFGFTAVDESELEAVQTATKKIAQAEDGADSTPAVFATRSSKVNTVSFGILAGIMKDGFDVS